MLIKIRKYTPLAFLCLLCCALIQGCKKKDTSEFTDSPIIESYLNAGDYFSVNVRRQIPFSDNVKYSADDINKLSLSVTYNNVAHQLQPLGDGKYIDSSIISTEGATYNLAFSFNKKSVTAYTYIPSKPTGMSQSVTSMSIAAFNSTTTPTAGGFTMPDPVTITWSNPNASYYLLVVENIETTLVAIRDFGTGTPPGNRFKKSPTNGSSEDIRSMEFQYFGRHRIILFHVLPDYATLYNQNSTSSQNLSNPSTSIVNGYGIFTGLNSDTLFVDINQE